MNKKGFTFIEVIIIFTIIFIMTAVLLSTSYKDRYKKELQAAAREVTASIRETQNYALTGKQKGSGTMPCTFQFAVGGNTYQINHKVRNLDDPNCDSASFEPFFDSVKLPLDVQLSALVYDHNASRNGNQWDSASTIEFEVPYGKITVDGSEDYDGIEVKLDRSGKYYYLCLYPTGMIEDLGLLEDDDGEVCPF